MSVALVYEYRKTLTTLLSVDVEVDVGVYGVPAPTHVLELPVSRIKLSTLWCGVLRTQSRERSVMHTHIQ